MTKTCLKTRDAKEEMLESILCEKRTMIRSDIPFADKVIELKKLFRKAEKLGACVEWKNWQDTLFKEAANAPDSAREAEVNKPNNQRTSTD